MTKTYKLIKVEEGYLDIMLVGSLETVTKRLKKAINYWSVNYETRMIFNNITTIITIVGTGETIVYYIGEVEPEPDLD